VTASPRDDALSYLEAHNVATLATTGPEGPWAAAVFYANTGFTLYFLSSPTSRHGRNIGENEEVAATIQEDYGDWHEIKGIQLQGQAKRLEGAERAEAEARFGAKFPRLVSPALVPGAIARALRLVAWYELEPTRVYFVDNSRGFAHRDEIPLQDEA
jgi:uncharacterized protein YhbP (UPF0306 family)